MRVALLCCVAAAGALLLAADPALATDASDFSVCRSARNVYDPAIEGACSRVLDAPDATATDRAMAYAGRARVRAAGEDYDSAIADAAAVIQLAPTAKAYLFIGFYRTLAGDRDEAIADFTKALTIEPTAEGYFLRAGEYSAGGEYRKAIADLNRVVFQVPGEPDPHRLRAKSLAALGLYDRAIGDYATLLGFNDRDSVSFAARGAAYLGKGNARSAIADYSAAIDVKPDWPYYVGRAAAYRAAGLLPGALADLTKAVNAHATAATCLALGDTQLALADAAKAAQSYEKGLTLAAEAVRTDPTAANYRDRALLYRALGQYAAAIGDLDEVIRLGPSADAYALRADAHTAIGDGPAAELDRARGRAARRRRPGAGERAAG